MGADAQTGPRMGSRSAEGRLGGIGGAAQDSGGSTALSVALSAPRGLHSDSRLAPCGLSPSGGHGPGQWGFGFLLWGWEAHLLSGVLEACFRSGRSESGRTPELGGGQLSLPAGQVLGGVGPRWAAVWCGYGKGYLAKTA